MHKDRAFSKMRNGCRHALQITRLAALAGFVTASIAAARAQDASVTLRHGPVPRLDWPAMTMTFRTKNAAQVRGLKTGDRVRFTFTQQDAGPRIETIGRTGQ